MLSALSLPLDIYRFRSESTEALPAVIALACWATPLAQVPGRGEIRGVDPLRSFIDIRLGSCSQKETEPVGLELRTGASVPTS